MIDRVRDEERREHVDRVVQMAHKRDRTEEEGERDEAIAIDLVIPEHQADQERKACVAREEQIAAEHEEAREARGVEYLLARERAEVRQRDEYGPDDDEERDRLHHERHAAYVGHAYDGYEADDEEYPPHEYVLDWKERDVIEDYIGDVVAHLHRRIRASIEIYDEGDAEPCQSLEYRPVQCPLFEVSEIFPHRGLFTVPIDYPKEVKKIESGDLERAL